MPRKKDDTVLDKKTKAKLTEEIITEINATVKEDVVNSVVSDVKEAFDKEYKNLIKEEITNELIDDIKENIRKDQSKLSRRKSFKIFRLYIYIILLIACSCILIYRLYKAGDIDFLNLPVDSQTTTTVGTTTAVVKDLKWYKDNYAYLVDKINISNPDLLKTSHEVTELATIDKLAIAYNTLNAQDIVVDGIIYSVDETKLSDAYKNMFGSLDGYEKIGFVVNDLNYAYSSMSNSFVAVAQEGASDDKIVNYIYNVREENDYLIFECNVALISDGYVYNIHNKFNKLTSVTDEVVDISTITDRLSSVQYKFGLVDGDYYLVAIN